METSECRTKRFLWWSWVAHDLPNHPDKEIPLDDFKTLGYFTCRNCGETKVAEYAF